MRRHLLPRRMPLRNPPGTHKSLNINKILSALESFGGQRWTSVGIRCANGGHRVDNGKSFGGHLVVIG
jgi:hypothetical protein